MPSEERRERVYNRYIPEDTSYARIEPGRPLEHPRSTGQRNGSPIHFPDFLSGGKDSLSGLLKTLRLDRIDASDILLLLIMLYLMAEGDDLDLVIVLGLTLLMGLGEDREG